MVQGPSIVRLRSSRSLLVFLTAFHCLAALSLWAPAWSIWLALLLNALVGLSLWRSTRSADISALRLEASGQLSVADASGVWQSGKVSPGSAVLPFLIVLRWCGATSESATVARRSLRTLVLPADALVDASQFRTLSVWLRWRAGASGARNA
ncbi:protein YgfX [Rhodocyclus tenuis]|uniref:protein YgfX n=1 Tax=Rhodocyclus tenuis TaxID=1066 RepID=UPI001908D263|nr:protein YgfX [Rhodocyclus tenuis]MBK1678870.1 hypothetical protein [Rhodocyclus tenuis]